jgi:hypothetical protein
MPPLDPAADLTYIVHCNKGDIAVIYALIVTAVVIVAHVVFARANTAASTAASGPTWSSFARGL